MHRALCLAAALAELTLAPLAPANVVYALKSRGDSHGIVMMIHGGGWILVGRGAAESVRGEAQRYADDGYTVFAPTYPADHTNIASLATDLSTIASHHVGERICLVGDSAGGHLALMLAIRRPALVRCVISRAGISDPAALTTVNPGLEAVACQLWCSQPGGLDAVSPLHLHRKLRARDVFLTVSACDPVVGADQSRALAAALPGSRLHIYACHPGPALVHATISAHATQLENAREARFLAAHLRHRH